MIFGLNLGNVHVLNVDEVIEKLEKYRDTVKDGALTKSAHSIPFSNISLTLQPMFYSEYATVASLFSTEGSSVKGFEENEAIEMKTLYMRSNGELSLEEMGS